jgi:cell division protein FtsL
MIRRLPAKQRNARVTREYDNGALVRLAMLLLCGLTLAGGFVYAGCQHFAALKLGYETESLRKVRNELVEDQRRFLLEREAAVSPARLERAARELGMQPLQAAQIDPLKRIVNTTPGNLPATTATVSSPARTAETKATRQAKIR